MRLPGQKALKLLLGKSREQVQMALSLTMQLDQGRRASGGLRACAELRGKYDAAQHVQAEHGT